MNLVCRRRLSESLVELAEFVTQLKKRPGDRVEFGRFPVVVSVSIPMIVVNVAPATGSFGYQSGLLIENNSVTNPGYITL